MTEELISPGRAIHAHAIRNPDEVILVCANSNTDDVTLTRREFDEWTSRIAHMLIDRGVGVGDYVGILLPNCVEHIVATFGIFKAGGAPMPVSYRMPPAERNELLAMAEVRVLFSDLEDLNGVTREAMADPGAWPSTLPPDVIPQPTKAVASGGSTGRPKLIVSPGAFAFPEGQHPFKSILRLQDNDMMYSPGPFYHNAPFLFTFITLYSGGRALINDRFDAGRALRLIEKYRPQVLNLVPTHMQRMLREADVGERDLSSVRLVWHLAAPCPAWAKQGFIDLLGADAVWELWAATEITGVTTISGSDWLSHRGSVGQHPMTEVRILDEDGNELPVGDVGEIFTRFGGAPPGYEYIGADPLPMTEDHFASVGDMGYVDEEGYMYLSDRRVDMIITGGANVYPAEVEAIISSHPGVRDVAVVGLRDDDLGRRVYAIVEPFDMDDCPTAEVLDGLCRKKLAGYKVPRGYEFIPRLPRTEAGKIRRLDLRRERDGN
ncbi:MAG: AMP-binding protein [Lysobacterales bacterium]